VTYVHLYLALAVVAWILFSGFMMAKGADDNILKVLFVCAIGALIWPFILSASVFSIGDKS
jgi:hypothetical protein